MSKRTGVALAALLLLTSSALAEDKPASSSEADANNPLANFKAFNLQNYYIPQLSELDDQNANTFWLRYAQPIGPWLLRASLPISRVPTGPSTTTSGLGDLSAFLAYLVDTGNPAKSFGIGPQISLPTASETETGTDKYQLGAAAVYFDASSKRVQWGGLLTWQTDVAGDDARPDTSVLALQPFYFFQLGNGLYLRGAPIAVFNLETSDYHVPVGLGVGKVFASGNIVYNIFIEPQFTILDRGPGQPEFQLFMGVNMQFK